MILLPEHIEKLGYKVTVLKDRIYMIHDFVSVEERKEILDYAEAATQDDWEVAYLENVKNFAMLKFGTDDIDALVKSGKYEITKNWSDKIIKVYHLEASKSLKNKLAELFKDFPNLEINGGGMLQRQQPGVPLTAHVDNHTDPSLDYAVVAYINDTYNDGEIFFEHKGVKLKPPAGALLVFPTTEEYLHGVEAPGEGPIRYVIPSFIRKIGFYDENKF